MMSKKTNSNLYSRSQNIARKGKLYKLLSNFLAPLLLSYFITLKVNATMPSSPTHLLCEGKVTPLGIDARQPRFSWWVQDDSKNAIQSAFQIIVNDSDGKIVWDSKKVKQNTSIFIPYEGVPLKSGQRYEWKVRTWDKSDHESSWSKSTWFEMALLDEKEWLAQWIGHPARFTHRSVPPVYLRKSFELEEGIKRARLYISARGIFEAELNGKRIGEDYFAPGWTDYAKRNQYMTYDVTDMLSTGKNALGLILADGWYTGNLKWENKKNWYGQETSIIAQLMIETEGGKKIMINTDESWKAATGPITESDFYNGEKYDARAELGDWSTAGYEDKHWLTPRIDATSTGKLIAKIIEPVRKQEILKAKSLKRAKDGKWVFDFGQNVVGWVKIRLKSRIAQTLTLNFAELLNPDGTLYTENYRSAESTDRYTFKDDKPVEWEPKFTFHGFRYVALSGLEEEPGLDAVEAVVLHTDAPKTGTFACSNEMLNQLQSNIVWGQKGNYLEVPTDCPQRDERLGWTGDAQVFVRTASFNMNILPFFEKWMADIRDAQQDNGIIPVFIPRLDNAQASPAWSDAVVICPWVIYERYGDKKILEDNFEAMRRWVDYQESASDELIFPKEGDWQGFGDWLAIDAPKPGQAPTPKNMIGTAYFAQNAKILAKIANILGKPKEATYYTELAEKVKKAFNSEFIDEKGKLIKETQTACNLALAFDLLPQKYVAATQETLVKDIQSRDWHLSTGFVGTGLLMPVLSKSKRNDVAFKVLLQESYPGWLYSIKQGATTMWERWNSYSHTEGFGNAGMNSFNHYAYGAVGEWMYSVIGGIDLLEPGYKKILIKPQPGANLSWAKAELESPYGIIQSDWKIENSKFKLKVVIPPNTSARVVLPGGKTQEIGSGEYLFEENYQ